MWLPATVSVLPGGYAVSVEDAMDHMRVAGADEQALVEAVTAAAQERVEALCGVRLITQTVIMRTEDWEDLDRLPLAPVQSISSITYVDTEGATQTLSTSVYQTRLYGLCPEIELKYGQVWPTIQDESLITVTAVIGYGAAESVPFSLRAAIKLIASDLYAFRETAQVGSVASAIPSQAAVDSLIGEYRRYL